MRAIRRTTLRAIALVEDLEEVGAHQLRNIVGH
jgi:hypothetical protein